ncbi:MAG: hypothetical protein KGZ96_05050 [Clostridia bacterium]|jgi:hypothetical protein|nr:hypothetical protein [Clostridia bacterium]
MPEIRITSIEIKNTSSGLYSVDEIISETLKIYRTGKIKHHQYNGLSDKPVKEYKYKVETAIIEAFFDNLVTKIKVQAWHDDYTVEVCDGWAWECKIRHSDNTVKKVVGTVEPPPRWNLLKNQIYKLAPFKVEPWIM